MTATPAPPAGARILTGNLPGIASMAALAAGFPAAEAPLADWDPPLLVAAQGDMVRYRRQGGSGEVQRAARLPGRPLLRRVAAIVRALFRALVGGIVGGLVGGLVSAVVKALIGARLSEALSKAFSGPLSAPLLRPL